MTSSVFSVVCFSHAFPECTPETAHQHRFDSLWGTYSSQKCAELAVFHEVLDDPDYINYRILYDEDIPREEYGNSDYACGGASGYSREREVMRVVITIKDRGIPVMETNVCIVKTNIISDAIYEKEFPEYFHPVDEEWEERIEDYYTNGPPSSWVVKQTKEEVRICHDTLIEKGISTPEDWIFSHKYGWVLKEGIEYYEEFGGPLDRISLEPIDEKWEERVEDYYTNGHASCLEVKQTKEEIFIRSIESYNNIIENGIFNPEDWIYSHQYGWVMKETIEDYEFTKIFSEEIAKFGAKTPEAIAEASMMREYELARYISHESDWICTEYGWLKKEWVTDIFYD